MKKQETKKSAGRTIAKTGGFLLLAMLAVAAGGLGFLTATEYRPAGREALQVPGLAEGLIRQGGSLTVLSWNIGFGALGDNADFFMDGGKMVKTADEERIRENMSGIFGGIKESGADVVFLQEVDVDSARTFSINEKEMLEKSFPAFDTVFANNFKVAYIPLPVPPLGKMDSGVMTLSGLQMSAAERIQLPVPFSWPYRAINLKRCLLVSRIPVQGSERELVLVNLHLEAYDDGGGKAAQTAMLRDYLESERQKGNYVIAGGDFNQTFSTVDASGFPTLAGKWQPGAVDVSSFDEGWQFFMDETVPSCRSLDAVYKGADKGDFQFYIIDGFIVSDNLAVESFAVQERDFVNADHNPAILRLTLK